MGLSGKFSPTYQNIYWYTYIQIHIYRSESSCKALRMDPTLWRSQQNFFFHTGSLQMWTNKFGWCVTYCYICERSLELQRSGICGNWFSFVGVRSAEIYKDTKNISHSNGLWKSFYKKKLSTWLDFISFFSYLYRAVAGGAILKVLQHNALIINHLR